MCPVSFGSHERAAVAVLFASFIGAASALAAPPRSDVGALLRAGAGLNEAMRGRSIVLVRALPGSLDGYVVRVGRRESSAAARSNALARDGCAYAAGETLAIAAVRVERRRIDVLFGPGGYDRDELAMPGTPRGSGIARPLNPQAVNVRAGESDPTDRELSEHQLAERRTQAAFGREESQRQSDAFRRHELAKTSGARIRLEFAHDLTLEELSETRLRDWLAPHARLVEGSGTPR